MTEGDDNANVSATGEDWKSALPEALRDAPYIRNAATPEAAFEEIKGAAAYMGNSVRIPGPDAGQEDWGAFRQKIVEKDVGLMPKPNHEDPQSMALAYQAMGRPEAPDGYSVEGIEGAPDGETLGHLRAVAHEAGLSQAQFKAMIADQAGQAAKHSNSIAEQREQDLAALKGEWGLAFDERIASGKRAAELTGAPEFVQQMIEAGTVDAGTLRWLHNIAGQLTGDGGQGNFQGKGDQRVMDADEVAAQLSEVNKRLFHDHSTTDEEKRMLSKRMFKLVEMQTKMQEAS
jgi:hypothetical protein